MKFTSRAIVTQIEGDRNKKKIFHTHNSYGTVWMESLKSKNKKTKKNQ
jgi:hypothetical protein